MVEVRMAKKASGSPHETSATLHIVGVEDYNIWFLKCGKKIGREGEQKDEVFKFHIFFI